MTSATKGSSVRPVRNTGGLGLGEGTALLVGSVLGPGVLALPHLAAAAAGPASILAWLALLALSVPVATTFAALGSRLPDGGGAATYVARAFGARAGAVVGWWFYAAVPVGTLAGALIGGEYVAASLGGGRAMAVAIACGLLALAFAANHAGLRMSGRIQLFLVTALAMLLVTAIVVAAPRADAANFTPFAPHGAMGVVHAAGVLFFAFAGWEAVSHLSAEFADSRLLPRATSLTLGIVGVLYLGLALIVTGVLGERAATSAVPLALLLEEGFGGAARPVTAVAALVLSFIAINTYVAGGSRLGAVLARDHALPGWFARGAEPGRPPHRSLALLAVLTGAGAVPVVVSGLGLDALMRATAACLAAVTVLAMAAAVRLLAGRGRVVALAATAFTAVVVASCGAFLLLPALLAVAGLRPNARRTEVGRTEVEGGGVRDRTLPAGAARSR
ncbi:amino acid permease [Actinomadura fulvescens]|uniref:APC family permease n=1 Tax=Actinomadura fulvescens TaxID=46160 RepID=UPI0031DCE6E5